MNDDSKMALLAQQVSTLTQRLQRVEDENSIRKLQYIYGYYLDKLLFDHIIDLFAEDSAVHFMGGVFKGKESVKRFFNTMSTNFTHNTNRPQYGMLAEHPMMQDVITVADDGKTAKGRFRLFMQVGWHESVRQNRPTPKGEQGVPKEMAQWWEGGLYENEYVKENGVWKLKLLEYRMIFLAPYETGWAHTPEKNVPNLSKTFPDDPHGPDELISPPWKLWPHMPVIHFHFPHPVTGKVIQPD